MKKSLKALAVLLFVGFSAFLFSGCDLFGTHTDTEGEVYAITVAGSVGGNVTGGALYEEGTTVTAIATPEAGYVFWHWIKSSQIVSTDATYTFIADDNINVVAYFLLEDQAHLEGVYYLQQPMRDGTDLFNPSQEVRRYTLNSDNSYLVESFTAETGVWTSIETGIYKNDNGCDVTFDSGESEIKCYYTLNTSAGEIDYLYYETVGLDDLTIYNTFIPWPATPFRTEHTYTLMEAYEDEALVVINAEEPEVFAMNIEGTFNWSYYVEGVQQVKTGTYEVLGTSIILSEPGNVFEIYEIEFETQAGVEEARMYFRKRVADGSVYEYRTFEFDYIG
ncbi:MAG: hypothetical protein AB7S44_01995 [Spirochaetales bacterium]